MRYVCVILAIILLAACSSEEKFKAVPGESYSLADRFSRTVIDLDKTGDGDSQLCWALAALNMYLFAINETEEAAGEYIDYIKEVIGNRPATFSIGFVAICAFNLKKYKIPPNLCIKPGDLLLDVYTFNDRMDLWIRGAILQRCVVGLFVQHPFAKGRAHALVCYGYYLMNNELFLYYVDSDDGTDKVYMEEIGVDETTGMTIFKSGEYIGYKITGATALKVVPATLPHYDESPVIRGKESE